MKKTLTSALILTIIAGAAIAETRPANQQQDITPAKNSQSSDKESSSSKIPHADEVKKMRKNQLSEYMERTWKSIDTNNDGVMTREESAAFSNKKFDDKDIDKDGKITRAEWDSFREERMKEAREKFGLKHGKVSPDGKSPMGDRKPPADRKPVGEQLQNKTNN